MKKLHAAAVILAVMSSAALAQPAPQANPLLTRRGFEAGGQFAHYQYLEPDFAELTGNRGGPVGAYTFTFASGLFSRIDVRGSYGELTYKGSGTKNNVPDTILETRGVVGADFLLGRVALSPYLGLGYRYLYNDLRGYGSTGSVGYRRYSNYLYAPVGLTTRIALDGRWVLVPTVEADLFIEGEQVSMLSDTGLGYTDVTNRQDKGRGHRVSFMVEKDRWAFGVWTHYWHVMDSDVQFAGVVGGIARYGLEPENYTRESGVELRFRF